MLKLSNFSKATLLAAFFLLLTGCNNKDKTDTETDLTTSVQSSQSTPDQVTSTQEEDSRELKTVTPTTAKTIPNKDENKTVTVNTLTVKENTPSTINVKSGTTLSSTVNSDTVNSDTVNSDTVNPDTPWVVNGHTLPPEPDRSVNDSTLLGVDVNDNGVRDDVERWIYETYKDKHPIHIDIAMQAARAWQKMLENPSKAKEIYPIVDAPSYCESYYKIYAKYFNENVLINEDITNEFFREKIIFNTQERKKAYLEYDKLLSGDSYTTPKIGDGKKLCDFNTSKYEE